MLVEDRSLQGSPGWGGPFVWQALLCFFAVLHLKAILCKILLPAAVHCSRLKTAVFLLTVALDLKEADHLLGFAIINRSSFSFCFCCAAFKVIPVNSCLFAQHWFLFPFLLLFSLLQPAFEGNLNKISWRQLLAQHCSQFKRGRSLGRFYYQRSKTFATFCLL